MIPYGRDYDDPSPQGEPEPDTWLPVDLGPYLRGEVQRPTPTVGMARRDGLRLLYPGKEHAIFGEMECGKSWVMLGCVMAELAAGHSVVYVHFEEADPAGTVERLVAMGVPDQDILERFRFVGPEQRVHAGAYAALAEPLPSLVLLDGVNEAMALHGQGIYEPDGAAAFRRLLVKPWTSRGVPVLAADHVVKDPEKRGRSQFGSVHKGNAVDGASILLENVEPFGRGQRGASRVYVTKDRPGHLRQHGTPDRKVPGKTLIGTLVLDDTRAWVPWTDLAFLPPPQEQADTEPDPTDAKVLAAVAALIADDLSTSKRRVRAKVGGNAKAVDDALDRLVVRGLLIEKRDGPARIFHPVLGEEAP